MFKGQANPERMASYLEAKNVHFQQRKKFCGVPVSSVGMGTYLGQMDEVTDAKVTQACLKAFEMGCNIFDTAINYRGQRAERSIGEVLRRGILTGTLKREDVFISTKGGFVPYDSRPVSDLKTLFENEYVSKGLATPSDLVAGCHCLEPKYIESQIEKSLKNLQIETVDLYYLHNPETQLEELPERIFYDKLQSAFGVLERAVKANKIGGYGLATWNGFRDEPGSQTYLSLQRCLDSALKAAQTEGVGKHHFKAIQLPFNLAMPQATLLSNQDLDEKKIPAADAAKELGLSVAVSAPLFQGRLCHNLPSFIVEKFPENFSQSHCALSFAASFPSIDTLMVGMKAPEHVEHNLAMLKEPNLSADQINSVLENLFAN